MEFLINDLSIEQKPLLIKRIQIKMAELKFNDYACFYVYFFKDAENYSMQYVKMETVKIEGDDYKAWNNDDNYIINLICEKLGITINKNKISNDDLGIVEPA